MMCEINKPSGARVEDLGKQTERCLTTSRLYKISRHMKGLTKGRSKLTRHHLA